MTGPVWREKREAAGMTLSSLAKVIGVSAPFLSDVEHGRRRFSPETEEKVRHALGLGPDPELATHYCRVCEAPLKVRVVRHAAIHNPNGLIGPGYQPLRVAYKTNDGYTCTGCGLHYDRIPGDER